MTDIRVPSGFVPEEQVDKLPKKGKEETLYRVLSEDETLREMEMTEDYIYHDGKWLKVDIGNTVLSTYFEIYQEKVNEKLSILEAQIQLLSEQIGGEK